RKGAGRDAAARRACCLARGRGASRSRAIWTTQFSKNPRASTKGVATFRNWLPRNGVCWPEGNRQQREIAACADASLGVACRAKGTRQRNGQETRPRNTAVTSRY